jgi:glycerophosphoryl diester phosphodiesterase
MLIIGHRGARAIEPENTLRALKEGMRCADFVEVDVRITRDGIPVVMHDAFIDRTTDGTGAVAQYTLPELKNFDAGKGERIPTLEEVCTLVSGNSGLFIEIKEPGSEGRIAEVLNEYRPEPLVIVSFHGETLLNMKERVPGAKTGFIYSKEIKSPVDAALAVKATVLLPKFVRVTQSLVRHAHSYHMLVIPWTLNTPDEFARANDLGVDGFATDDPCNARSVLQKTVLD